MSVDASRAVKIRDLGSVSRKVVMLILADYADENWSCFPSQERIAAEANLSERTVRSTLAQLESDGLVVRRARRGAEGRRATDRLFLVEDRLESLPRAWPKPATRETVPTGSSCRLEQPDPTGSSCRLDGSQPATDDSSNRQPTTVSADDTSCSEEVSRTVRSSAKSPDDATPPKLLASPFFADAQRLCNQLADDLGERDKRPTVTKRWLADMEALLRIDGRSPADVERVLRWLANASDAVASFWRPVVRSPHKLREKWALMAEQYQRERTKPSSAVGVHDAIAEARELRRRREAG